MKAFKGEAALKMEADLARQSAVNLVNALSAQFKEIEEMKVSISAAKPIKSIDTLEKMVKHAKESPEAIAQYVAKELGIDQKKVTGIEYANRDGNEGVYITLQDKHYLGIIAGKKMGSFKHLGVSNSLSFVLLTGYKGALLAMRSCENFKEVLKNVKEISRI